MRAGPSPHPQAPRPHGSTSFRDAAGEWDDLVTEAPLMIEIAGSQMLNFRTPGRDEDLVRGFLLSEGFITETSEILSLTHTPSPDGSGADTLKVQLTGSSARPAPRFREIRPSCGSCGDDTLVSLRPLPLPVTAACLSTASLIKAIENLSTHQPLFKSTGGCHAAAITDASGDILAAAEDVGRHNAVDKAIGEWMRNSTKLEATSLPLLGGGQGGGLHSDLSHCILALSGRAGYELVAKAVRAGIGTVVSVSAATSLSLRTAKAHALTLAGFCRGGKVRVYFDPGRVKARN